jgi:hypothetical protein
VPALPLARPRSPRAELPLAGVSGGKATAASKILKGDGTGETHAKWRCGSSFLVSRLHVNWTNSAQTVEVVAANSELMVGL